MLKNYHTFNNKHREILHLLNISERIEKEQQKDIGQKITVS